MKVGMYNAVYVSHEEKMSEYANRFTASHVTSIYNRERFERMTIGMTKKEFFDAAINSYKQSADENGMIHMGNCEYIHIDTLEKALREMEKTARPKYDNNGNLTGYK